MAENLPKPSEKFLLAIRGASSGVINCEHCDRVHFAPNSDFDFDAGELEELLENQKTNPDRYISHSEDGVEWGDLDDKQYVLDCPCNSASKYEKLFWNHRHLIAKYFDSRAKEMTKQAREATDIASRVKTSV